MSIHKRINTHQYPLIYFKFPYLIHITYFWLRLVYQRIGITYSYLLPCLQSLPNGSLIADAGFGEGQFLFRYARQFKHLRFEGLDYNENTLKFANAYKKYFNFQNITLQQMDLTNWKKDGNTLLKDGIFCIGVLHCIADDENVLKNFYTQLKSGGWLVIYTPLRSRSILGFYKRIVQRFKTYDSTFRTHEYTPQILQEKLAKNGFLIREERFTHGTLGILSYEIYTAFVTLVAQGNIFEKIYSVILLYLFFPIILIFKYLDKWFHRKKEGNAVLIVAEKTN
jgi:ubiquinone/menaquinone biosynthesis C-methylase UbiE